MEGDDAEDAEDAKDEKDPLASCDFSRLCVLREEVEGSQIKRYEADNLVELGVWTRMVLEAAQKDPRVMHAGKLAVEIAVETMKFPTQLSVEKKIKSQMTTLVRGEPTSINFCNAFDLLKFDVKGNGHCLYLSILVSLGELTPDAEARRRHLPPPRPRLQPGGLFCPSGSWHGCRRLR